MDIVRGRPNDERGFIHKRIIGAVTGGISGLLGGGPLGGLRGALGGFARGGRGAVPQATACPPGFSTNIRGECVQVSRAGSFQIPFTGTRFSPTSIIPGGAPAFFPEEATRAPRTAAVAADVDQFGDAVVGRYGAAIEPATREMDVRVCPRGTVLGLDGLCYNRRDIANSERWWPRGRRPLLTGGEMRCISVAASAAKKLQRKQKQLEAMGMLRKPSRRAAPKLLAAGHHAHVSHD